MLFATTSFKKIGKLKHKNKVIQGSQGAGKTFSILLRWVLLALKSNEEQYCSIVTATFPALRDGALKDFKTICSILNIPLVGTKSPAVYTIGKWTFQFFSVDKENKGLGARRDRLFINEANRMTWKIARQLINRTHIERIFDFNPVKEFWAHTQFVKPSDCDFIKLTYKDNEKLPQSEVESIEKHAPWGAVPDPNFWRVYGLGEIGFTEGVIFNFDTFTELPEDVKIKRMFGIDFGWNDPYAIIDVAFDRKNMILYWKEVFYESEREIKEGAKVLKDYGYNKEIAICDNEPRSVMTLRKNGIKAAGIGKKPKLDEKILLLKQAKLMVHEDSFNLISELSSYSYKAVETPQGTMFDSVPADGQQDHAIDGGGYASIVLMQ